MLKDYKVVLLGYVNSTNPHTNWYPWFRFFEVFKHLGTDCVWCQPGNVPKTDKKRIFITWNLDTSKELVEKGIYKEGDIILQKLTSLSKFDGKVNWTTDPMKFFKDWTWPLYKMVEDLYDSGINIYGFGCKTISEPFPEKDRIVKKMGDRIIWIPFGSSLYAYDEIMNAKPIIKDNFEYDVGFVGSLWGKVGRGNRDSWEDYMKPILAKTSKHALAGKGLNERPCNDDRHKYILKNSRICPIINAPSWRIEKGIQDRFWSVFTSGRFGVVDSEGVYDFFNEDEVVCEIDPGEYIEKTMYYYNNVEKQLPFIEKVQKRIKEEYNYYKTWEDIFKKIEKEN